MRRTRAKQEVLPSEPAPLVDVFISYARTDQAIARRVAETLKDEGFEVWFDDKIYAGATWKSLLMTTLASAKAVLVLWSKQSVSRPWVLKEAELALKSTRLVPVQIEDCKLPARFAELQIAMMIGWDGSARHPEIERLLSGLARLAPPSRIDNVRPGFATSFLGVEVPLPAITGVGEEFRYLHFSVVMNPARRLAWYVAYNMEPDVKVTRGDRWLPDPMLPASFQPTNDHFRGTGFDRGHLVSPRTVSWGSPREAELANHQSFFWTNTAPQHPRMNQEWWLGVEQWERHTVRRCERAIGFSGPVLADDDPPYAAVEQTIGRLRVRQNFRLPRRFFKLVVARRPSGELETAAFLLDQDALRDHPPVRPEASRFRVEVKDLEAATGLDWGEAVRAAPEMPRE